MKTEYSAGGIVHRSGRVLLVFQKSTQSWAFPKGHIEGSETNLEAAKRELEEETGIRDLTLILELGSYTRPSKRNPDIIKHITMFLFATEEDYVCPKAADVQFCEWFTIADAPARLSYNEDAAFLCKTIEKIKLLAL